MEDYFSEEAIENNADMYWDEERRCAVDRNNNETSEFQGDEELPGFSFDKEALDELNREVDRKVMPEDSDSISTFRQAKTPAKETSRISNVPLASGSGSRSVSAASIGTSLTNKSYATLDSRISGLASQMQSNQSKTEKQMKLQQEQFEKILDQLHTLSQQNINIPKEASNPPKTGSEQ